ncbi:2-dehydropantoate 2-reductase [Domibacillus tundrae]|uniref:2-dehydropantoate 2-reductase n=1 Tax=Domibacillus tundrae TaxID=1587527 RepID=UPI00339819FE
MNIHIIGGGAIGLFFASQWSSYHQVTVQARTKEQAKRLETDGIRVIENNQESVHIVKTAKSAPVETNLVVVAVKQYHLNDVLKELPDVRSLLFIQNGLSHLKQIQPLSNRNIYAASVTHGIAKIDERTIRVNGRDTTKMASVKGGHKEISCVLGTPGFSFQWEPDVYEMLVEKMAANTVINPLTALLNVKNGELVENSEYCEAVETLCEEFSSVFPYKTIEAVTQSDFDICRKTAPNESSMLSDVKAGRMTELNAIVGALLDEAARNNVQVPAFSILYNLVKGKTPDFNTK